MKRFNLKLTILKIKTLIKIILRPEGKFSFLSKIPKDSSILDVGCGNNSPFLVKSLLPNSYYVGLDISEYNTGSFSKDIADEYILTDPDIFVNSIKSIKRKFDAIISSHNLEHCNDRLGTINAMIDKLNKKGKIFLSFPSKESINFPKRIVALNYYDDPTHKDLPPNFELILEILREKGLRIVYSQRSYKPFLLNMIGNFTYLISFFTKKIHLGVWEKWGFESIIIAENRNANS